MTSEMSNLNHPCRPLAHFAQMAEEYRLWKEANAELVADWEEAERINELKNKDSARSKAAAHMLSTMADALAEMGAPLRSSEAVQAEYRAEPGKRRYEANEAVLAVKGFIASRSPFLVLFGGVGSGKTCASLHALAQLQKPLYDEWNEVWDCRAGRFIRAVEAARLSRFDDSEKWDDLLRVRWLVLDDLGVESMNDYWRERLNELIDVRYGNKLRTIITCNLSPEEFKAKYGDRIASRIREDGMVAGCGTTDFRRNPL